MGIWLAALALLAVSSCSAPLRVNCLFDLPISLEPISLAYSDPPFPGRHKETYLCLGNEDAMHKKKRVLVVDDDPNMSKMLVTVLVDLGYDILPANNGIEALKVLQHEQVDLIFTDIVMPEMDGFELCEEVRLSTEWRNLPIVAVSTYTDSHYMTRALLVGANDYLTKPIEASRVEKVLGRVSLSVEEVAAHG